MKLIVAGSTGYVATEVIRQAVAHRSITSVVVLGRQRPPAAINSKPDPAGASTLKYVICNDFEDYSNKVKMELSGADACIWTIGIIPSRSKTYPWDQVVKICRDYAITGIRTISQLSRGKHGQPFRFLYMSGHGIERNPTKKAWVFGDYLAMRGEAESRVLEYARQSGGTIEACIAKPGLIGGHGVFAGGLKTVLRALPGSPAVVDVEEVAAAMIDQVTTGFNGKDDLLNEDLVRIGREALKSQSNAEV